MSFFQKCFGGSVSTSTSTSASTSSRKQPYHHYTTTVEQLCHRFSLDQLLQFTNNFHESLIIGSGPYGVAYKASIFLNGHLKHVAIKRLRQKPQTYSEGIALYKNDILFTCQLHHPNLLSLVGFCDDNNEMIAVHEYAPNGSLYDHIYTKPPTPLSWKKRLEIGIGVARGLHYLHCGTKRTIIHDDVSTVTIMLDENWVPKITFFGVSRKAPKSSEKGGKRRELEEESVDEGKWESPDVMHKYDVFCFGELLRELILFYEEGDVIDEIFEVEIEPECGVLYMDIAESCLNEDPHERPDMGEVEVQLERVLQLQEEADTIA